MEGVYKALFCSTTSAILFNEKTMFFPLTTNKHKLNLSETNVALTLKREGHRSTCRQIAPDHSIST